MKTFIFKVENTTKNPSRYGGRKQKAVIYQSELNSTKEILARTKTNLENNKYS